MDSIAKMEELLEQSKKTKKGIYSVSLNPDVVEQLKEKGYGLTEVCRIGIDYVLFNDGFFLKKLPVLFTNVGIGLILLCLAFTMYPVLSGVAVLSLSVVVGIAGVLAIGVSLFVVVKMFMFSTKVKRGDKNG